MSRHGCKIWGAPPPSARAQGGGDGNRPSKIPVSVSFLWIARNIEIAFWFTVAG